MTLRPGGEGFLSDDFVLLRWTHREEKKVPEIPLKAKVYCTDGPAGESTTLVVDPRKLTVTHVVVREDRFAHIERIVPADRVVETTADTIRLNCTVEELHSMGEFLKVEYQEAMLPAYYGPDMMTPYYYTDYQRIPIVEELVPAGGRPIHPGDPVAASDGVVGELSELLTDPQTGQITHLVLREGHLWGNKKVLLPISMVESRTAEGTIRLHADKKAISALLAVPAREHYGVADATLLVWTFEQAEPAKEGMRSLKHLAKQQRGAVLAAALLAKDAEGKVTMDEMGDVDKKHGALFGAVAGGLLGLVGGPAGLAVAAAAGALTGGVVANRMDLGFPEEFLEVAAKRLETGRSGILALVEKGRVEEVVAALTGVGGVFQQMPVTDELLARLAAEV
jgi:uncharacterized membrane protein